MRYGPGFFHSEFDTDSEEMATLLLALRVKLLRHRRDGEKITFYFSNSCGQVDALFQDLNRAQSRVTMPQLEKARSELRKLTSEAFGFDLGKDIGA